MVVFTTEEATLMKGSLLLRDIVEAPDILQPPSKDVKYNLFVKTLGHSGIRAQSSAKVHKDFGEYYLALCKGPIPIWYSSPLEAKTFEEAKIIKEQEKERLKQLGYDVR